MPENTLQLDQFLAQQRDLDSRIQKLELTQQPILGETVRAERDLIYFPLYAESPSIFARDAFTGGLGLVTYISGNAQNAAPAIQFRKESTWTFKSGTLYIQFFQGDYDTGGGSFSAAFPRTVRIRVNPTISRLTSPAPYYRGASGTVLTLDGQGSDSVTPTTEGQLYTYTFDDESELATLFTTGQNTILCQQDYDSPDSSTFGYAKLILVLYGYHEP